MNTSNSLKTALAGLGLIASVQFSSSQTIPPSLAAPAGSVNTNVPGMKMHIVQGNTRLQMTAAAPAEALISGKAIDPQTGLPFENVATPNPVDGSFFYDIDRYINMHEQGVNGNGANAADNFSMYDTAPHNIPDDPEPGIPGTLGGGDDFVMEFTGFLQLPSGTVRFGVNSDDGFKLTIGSGINTRIQALQLIILDGTRGFGNTEANITVTQAGLYPFRLLFWERGGANSGVELYTFAPGATTGNRYLINDTNQGPNSIRSYRELVGNPPTIVNITPSLTTYVDVKGNVAAVPPAPYMWVEVQDGATTVDTNTVSFALDGTLLATNITKSAANITMISAQAPTLGAGTLHTNRLIYADSGGTRYTNIWTFTVGNYPTIPTAYAIASVDTSKPGFRAKVQQMSQTVNKQPNTGQVPNAERQIANGYIDPATGLPYDNLADLSTVGADGYFVYPDVINLNETVPNNAGSFTNDAPVQGITGNPNGQEHYVSSIETILELKAGPYRFGVNSDDGFRLSAGRGPGDVVGVQLGTAGDRGPTDSFVDFLIGADGFYPFRLMWWETGGGSACEFFVVDLATGTKTLINDLTATAPIKAYRESAASRPYISRVLPTVNFVYAFADQDVVMDITDGAIPLNARTAALTINGTTQTITENKTNNVTTVRRSSSVTNLLPSGVNTNSLTYSFTEGGNTVTVTNAWVFTVPRYIRPIPAANKVLANQVSGAGFHVRAARQIDRSGNADQVAGGRYTGQSGGGNNMPRPEIELADGYINPTNNLPYPNLLDTSTANPDGSYDVAEVLNFNHSTTTGLRANAGIFNSDTEVPGMPGTGTSNLGLDNTVHEFQTYLDLKAGAYIFGLNVDDGWTCISAPNPRDTLGTLLGFRDGPGGQNGTPFNNPNAAFNVVVPEDGIYPFRILFWEGGGGVNLEFAALDRNTGTQILVNDTSGIYPSTVALPGNTISPITAYNTYTGPVRPWTKFSVYPMPYIGTVEPRTTTAGQVTLWQNVHQQSGPGPIQVKVGAGNPVDIANDEPRSDQALVNKPFGDAVGAVVAELGTGTVGMVLDGVNVTPTVTGSTDKLVLYTPPQPLSPSSNHVAGLVYAGTTNYWTFSVITYTNIPTGVSLPSNQADPNAVGFLAKVFQATNGQPNTVARAELQIAGKTNNVAIPNPNRPSDGAYIITNIINWNVTKNPGGTPTEIGNFQPLLTGTPDDPVPGIPGTGLTGNPRFENITAEIFAYLDLPAGYQKFGVNGDDGWKVQVGTQGQTNGTILFTRDRGAGARDIPFAFVTPEAGLVPIRLVWYQGGGGGNLEFFTYGPNNTKIAVNDRNNPNSVKAYYSLITGPVLKFTSATFAGGTATFTWTGTGILQQATVLTGSPSDWTDLSQQPVGNSYQVQVSSAAQTFYRLRPPP